jgi:uncharacterized membrane protein YgdD (TMEM256/DUF423 family)
MPPRSWILVAALLCGTGVLLGAFGAHGLREGLEQRGQLENWHTAVRYQVWHGLGLLALAAPAGGLGLGRAVPLLFGIGSLLFSGSLYGLALGGSGSWLGPVTPIGGTLLLVGWSFVGRAAWRSRS